MYKHTTRTQAGVRNKGLYKNLYEQIDMTGPSMDDMPSQAAPGASMATQARAAGYQDMYRNIQAMRDSEYKKELSRGEITSEFSGLAGSGSRNNGRGHQRIRKQRDVRNKGLYKHLLPEITPIHHPYLPHTTTKHRGLSGYLGDAAQKTAPGLMVALGLAIAYFLFFRKKAAVEEPETAEEIFIEEEIQPAASRYYF